jgi:eukaryotic-like serine/threonine-protein kinase
MSTGVDRARVEALFEAALELRPTERAAYVADACGADAALSGAVLALLQAHDRSGVLEVEARTLLAPDAVPERLGPYRVLREIGRGGMGLVYDGERDDGQFSRRVAIKIIRGDSDASLHARVLAERQILAALDHANIARLLDGGLTPDGRPYLVMEHVEGLPIDVYCDRMRLTVAERLRLFLVVARAVDFAHRNLVVHRDLKPSNIMVTPDGRVKLLDFGVAKLLNPYLGGGAGQTRDLLALTPEYASPEQLRNEGLTTTTDVYSLAVVLYELLTGRRPFAQHEASPADHMSAVCGADAERPSARVLRPEQLTSADGTQRTVEPGAVAYARQTTPVKLARRLDGELDAILAMALRPEPPRRYASVELMAQDIERHLNGRTVHAHRGSRGYAFGKLVRRHRAQAAAGLIAALSLLAGTGVAAWQAAAAKREKDGAEAAQAQAEEVTEFLLELFESGDPMTAPSGGVTAADLVRRGTARVDALAGQPLVQARMLGVLGRIHQSLGEFEQAQRLTERALAIHAAPLHNGQPGDGLDPAARAELLVRQGILQRQRGVYDSAQTAFLTAREIQQRVLGPSHAALGATLYQLASIAVYLGDLPEAERRAYEALEMQQRELGDAHRLTLNTLRTVGAIHWRRGETEKAEQALRRVIALRPQAQGSPRTEVLSDRLQLAELLVTYGDAQVQPEAESIYRSAMAEMDPRVADNVGLAVWSRNNLATILERRSEHEQAQRLLVEAYEIRRNIHGEHHPNTVGQLSAIGRAAQRSGDLERADSLLQQVALAYRNAYGERSPPYSNALHNVAELRLEQQRLEEADSLIVFVLDVRRERARQSVGYADALRFRALVKAAQGRYEEAETMLQDALATAQPLVGQGSRALREIHGTLANLYDTLGRTADAERHRTLASR